MSLARCLRCEALYSPSEEEGTPCCYHPGKWRQWWSCCKDPLPRSPGCRSSAHVEDLSARAAIDSIAHFPPPARPPPSPHAHICETVASPQMVLLVEQPGGTFEVGEEWGRVPPAAQRKENPSPSPPSPPPPPPPPPVASVAVGGAAGNDARTLTVPYVVGAHDTFASVSLRHQMSERQLAELNLRKARAARPGDVLLVYVQRADDHSEEDVRREKVRQFRRASRCPAGEALYYLESNGYEVEQALAVRRADVAWEREQVRAHAQREEMPSAPPRPPQPAEQLAAWRLSACLMGCLPGRAEVSVASA